MFNQIPLMFSAITAMLNSRHHFCLTGSRFFETDNPLSDYDFFVEDGPEVLEELLTLGFAQDRKSYNDKELGVQQVLQLGQIHVQLVKDAATKEKIQNKLKPLFQQLRPGKEQAKLFWGVAAAILSMK